MAPTSTNSSTPTETGVRKSVNFLIIGAGSRGNAYAEAIVGDLSTEHSSQDDINGNSDSCEGSGGGRGTDGDKGKANMTTAARVAAVAEPDEFKRAEFGRKFIWGRNEPTALGRDQKEKKWDEQDDQLRRDREFTDWREWVRWEQERRHRSGSSGAEDDDNQGLVIHGVFVCTLDESHAEILQALSQFENLHVLCEKPLALSLDDCMSIRAAYQPTLDRRIFSIGHVLRYSPHNILLHKLVTQDRAIGDVVSIEHTEPVGWWHFAHSYVRGNWRRATPDLTGTLLFKSCHDIDLIMWLLASPGATTEPEAKREVHLPNRVSSTGQRSYFHRRRKPQAAGSSTTNCLSCPLGEEGCAYSAKKIYRDRWLRQEKDTGWPLKIVLPEIEDIVQNAGWETAEQRLMDKLAEDYDQTTDNNVVISRSWYGRCVYECDNEVVDDQTVTFVWDESMEDEHEGKAYRGWTHSHAPKTAIFHLSYATAAQCDRRGRIYGTEGEIAYDSKCITVYTFADEKTVEHFPSPMKAGNSRKGTIMNNRAKQKRTQNHGGGDVGLAGNFVDAVSAVENGIMTPSQAQMRYVGCDLEEMILSHAAVFVAEGARIQRKTMEFARWWQGVVRSRDGEL